MALAGLWETWCGADGSEIDTACLLTTSAGPPLAGISDRMPVIVSPDDFERWLTSGDPVGDLLRATPADFLAAEPVTPRVDSVMNDGPDLIESKIDGEFEGWSGETLFKFANGQIWQQVTYNYTYHYWSKRIC